MLKKFIVNVILPLWYRFCCIKKTKNIALFVEVRDIKTSTNFLKVMSSLKKHNEGKNIVIKSHFLKLGSCSRFRYFWNCVRMMPKMAKAKYVFLDESSNVISALKVRRDTKVIQLWHGCGALKKFGKSVNANARYYGNEDLFTVSSKNVVWAYEEATGLPKEKICPIGVPRSDVYFRESYREKCSALRDELLAGRNKKIILFAPTFRGNIARARDSKGLNLDLMCKNLSQEYIIICKYHNALKAGHSYARRKDFYYDVTDKWTIEEAMGVCDILITDYSSLIFEYALLNKPAIFYAYDFKEYSEKPGIFIDYMNEIPGPICESTLEIIKEIKSGGFDVDRMKRFRDKYMDACDGHSTRRLLDIILGD